MGIAEDLSQEKDLIRENFDALLSRFGSKRSQMRRSSQLKFHLEAREQQRKPDQPISNDVRRAEDVRALLQHFEWQPEFWNSVIAQVSFRRGLDLNEAQSLAVSRFRKLSMDLLAASEKEALQTLLLQVVESVEHHSPRLERPVAEILALGLRFLARQLENAALEGAAFREVWLLLWPVLSDCDLLPPEAKNFRGVIQKIVSQSF